MRLFRYALMASLLVILGVAIYQTMVWIGIWGNGGGAQVMALDEGDQEIAFIEPATSSDEWGRLVTALKLVEDGWPKINPTLGAVHVSTERAFPHLTADVPEIVFTSTESPTKKLRLRWYKISGEHDVASWIAKLQARKRAPLAIVGGGTSDRAVKLAQILKDAYGDDPALPAPVFLITTATSERTASGNTLINIYRDRSFRFSFTNKKMVDALLAFIQHRQYKDEHKEWAQNLWVNRPADPPAPAKGANVMHAVTWEDERYSQDMNALFQDGFQSRFPKGEFIGVGSIPYSAGGFYHATPQEQNVVSTFLALRTPVAPHSFLVLPTGTVRMRRFLVNLYQRSPKDARNLVVLNGDAISFHAVYRDREVIWNILDLPYSLVFFSHRNPVDPAAGFKWIKDARADSHNRSTTGTHDILLYRDIFEAVLYAAYDKGRLLGDPLQVRERLNQTCWLQPPLDRLKTDSARVCNPLVQSFDPAPPAFFDADGNRKSHTGEHIVWVKPKFTGDGVDMVSRISIWTRVPDPNGGVWQLYDDEDAYYYQPRPEEAP